MGTTKKGKDNRAQLFKTALKNEHYFYRIALKKPHKLLSSLIAISRKYSSLNSGPGTVESSAVRRFALRGEAISLGWEIVNSLQRGERMDFLKEIDIIRKSFNLGKEWKETLISFTMTGILCPPIFNLYIEKEEPRAPLNEGLEKLRVSLILNPDTSPADIKNAWSEIKKVQKSLWPDFVGFNLTKNSAKNLNEQLESLITKLAPVEDKEKYGAFSPWEEVLLKAGRPMKEVLEYRKKGGGEASRKSIKIKQRKTDKDFVMETQNIKSSKKAKKAADNFRHRKSRMLKA